MKTGQTQGRQLQRWLKAGRRLAIQAMVPTHVKREMEAEARDRQIPVSALAAEILCRAFDTSPTTGHIFVSSAHGAACRGKRIVLRAMIDNLDKRIRDEDTHNRRRFLSSHRRLPTSERLLGR
jgi:hypothetical protein